MTTNSFSAAQRIAVEARQKIPPFLLTVSGRALYSPASTLVSGSAFYFLGVNPGEVSGATHLHSNITVEADLRRLESDSITEHGYLDEQWKGYLSGQAPIRLRGQHVFAILIDGTHAEGKSLLRITPTSNFVLQRSPSVEVLQERTRAKAGELAL